MAKIMSVTFILFLIVVATIMNGFEVEGESLECAQARIVCLLNPAALACIIYCKQCNPSDPIC
jgi:hypothetical protein